MVEVTALHRMCLEIWEFWFNQYETLPAVFHALMFATTPVQLESSLPYKAYTFWQYIYIFLIWERQREREREDHK